MRPFNARAFYIGDIKKGEPLLFELKFLKKEGAYFFVMKIDPEFRYPIHVVIRDPDWIVQWDTGMKDSKGIEIYEGDIVSQVDGYTCQEVVWGNQSWEPACLDECEVIGNVIESPNLLTPTGKE